MVKVKKQPGQSDDQLIRNFSRQVSDAGIIQEVRDRQMHLKPSQRKKYEQQKLRKLKRRTV